MTPEISEKIAAFKRELTFIIVSDGCMEVLRGANEAIDHLTVALARSSERTEEDRKILRWLGAGSGVGLSSKAIALTALGEMPKEPNYPHDPDDFSRCKALLENIPLARRGLEKLGTDGGPVWAALVARWDEIDAQFEASEAAGWDKDDGKCYRLMQSIIYPVFGWRVPVSASTEGGK